MGGGSFERRYDFRPPKDKTESGPSKPPSLWRRLMSELLALPAGRALYALRQQTVESVFGIVREVMQFRRFKLRGIDKVSGEWQLVGLAHNVRRLHRLVVVNGA